MYMSRLYFSWSCLQLSLFNVVIFPLLVYVFIGFFEGIQAFHDACTCKYVSLLDFCKHLTPVLFAVFLFMYVMMSLMILMLTVFRRCGRAETVGKSCARVPQVYEGNV